MALDFLKVGTRSPKKNEIEIYPKFIVNNHTKDLMIKGRDFYAIWDERVNLWSTDEQAAIELIDRELDSYYNSVKDKYSEFAKISVAHMEDADSGMINKFHQLVQKQLRDNYHPLDETLIFANQEVTKDDYASRKLPYPLEPCDTPGYEKLMSVLYSPEERHKIEWAIGAIISGDSKTIQKFLVFYGSAGTGKSTVLNIIQMLFEGYWKSFDAKSIGNSNAQFALESLKDNPLVGIQHDGDLSRIEDNTRLNSLVSHEVMTVNEKFKATYGYRFNTFLLMGTNKPVKITDAKSGIIRRLIDVSPTGNKLSSREYKKAYSSTKYELGGIACHCLDVYKEAPDFYDDYIPFRMLGASNDFYNFVLDNAHQFRKNDGTTLKQAWELYDQYIKEAKLEYPMNKRVFKEELKNYFCSFEERFEQENGKAVRSYYKGFRSDKFEAGYSESKNKKVHLMEFSSEESYILDSALSGMKAQYATKDGVPEKAWDNVSTTMDDIDPRKLHYVMLQPNHIVIDYDIRDEEGNKCFYKNLVEASKMPETYAELSKSGGGIHLHYFYTGDPSMLADRLSDDVEIKVYKGKMSLRRKFTKSNGLPIATINSGLPLKEVKKEQVLDKREFNDEYHLKCLIAKAMRKEIDGCAHTKPAIDFIVHILNEAYNSGLKYDVTSLRNDIIFFAKNSNNNAPYCLGQIKNMKFKSESEFDSKEEEDESRPIAFFDIEIFPNLFIVCYKLIGEHAQVIKLINPDPKEIELLIDNYRLIGFNNRKYDNHLLYARLLGYTNKDLYNLSKNIIKNKRKDVLFANAYNISYTDVYDFATVKKSLKKWEIDLGIHHQELRYDWDSDLDESHWNEVAEYCANDVIATEAVFNNRKGDFLARQIQVSIIKSMHGITNVSVNNTTNSLSTKIIFGNDKNTQSSFNWRDLSKPVGSDQYDEYVGKFGEDYKFRVFNSRGLPEYRDYIPGEKLPDGWSILPFFPKYSFDPLRGAGKMSVWADIFDEDKIRDADDNDPMFIKEGGLAQGKPGLYGDVKCLDVASQHPHSAIAEVVFGPKYTPIFKAIVDARVAIKHRDFEAAADMLGGALKPFLSEEYAKDLANALKIVINSVYGLTSASYDNAFRDPKNIDNIIAKRGNLFMNLLREEVISRGYDVCHIKTDCIKIPDATTEIQKFVEVFGREYGYKFELEEDFSKFCLVNKAEYVGMLQEGDWIAVGAKFIMPYVFKTFFSKEPIEFKDMCITYQVQNALYLDHDESLSEGAHSMEFVGKVGSFVPIKAGCGGARLLTEGTDKEGNKKYDSASGAKGYRWLEAEYVKEHDMQDCIDYEYFDKLCDTAKKDICNYVDDWDWFISPEKYKSFPVEYAPWQIAHNDDELPPWDVDDTFDKR